MAEGTEQAKPAGFSEADKAKARAWFKKGEDCRNRREYDYAIECYITGLGFWPDAVEEGHMPLRALWVQRQQAGGKPAGMMEKMKKPTGGKDAKQAMLNAEYLLAKDPGNDGHAEAMLKAAVKAGYLGAALFVAPLLLELLKKEKKPNLAKFKTFRETLEAAGDLADQSGDAASAGRMYEKAVESLDYLRARMPTDDGLRNDQRDLASKLTITRGKYSESESFRESVRDVDKQKLLHDADRVQQGEQTLDDVIAAARAEAEANPDSANKINAYADALLKRENRREENEAIRVLTAAFERSKSYAFKIRADDVRLRQLRRQTRQLREKAMQTGSEEDAQQARLSEMEERSTELEIFRERVAQYPTDLRIRYQFGAALFRNGEYDEAIPALQAAQNDPRNRFRCLLLLGRCFLEKGVASEAVELLKQALEAYENPSDDLGKELTYWLARACADAGNNAEARTYFGRLVRVDYNYADGDARARLEQLK